jgi:hypothetical protein
MKLFVTISADGSLDRVVTLTVEPSDTVGAALSKLLTMEGMEERPDGEQRLQLPGGKVLENNVTLEDAHIQDNAALEYVDLHMDAPEEEAPAQEVQEAAEE